jgi:HAD superfamily hydrolase (TIGR01490 family)
MDSASLAGGAAPGAPGAGRGARVRAFRRRRAVTWPTFDPPPAVAFFDVDGTLLAETTTYLFARVLRRRGMIKRSFVLRAMYHGLQHRFGRLDYGRLVAFGLRSIARVPVAELERIAAANFDEHVRPRLYEGVVEHLADLRRRGTAIVLVSSSPAIVIEPLSRYLGCTATVTTPVRIETGRLVGAADGPPCYGEGKLYWARRWAEAHQIAMDAAVAYADNWSDRALLEEVGRAVVVHPHRKLKRLALRRGWTIVRPRRPRRPAIRDDES